MLILKVLQNPVGLLFTIIAVGLLIGNIPLGKIRLGGSGVLLAGLAFGHFGYQLPSEVQTIGVVLFVYTVGLKAGPQILQSLKNSKGVFVIMALIIVISAAGISLLLKSLFGISSEMLVGIYAGAMTSTPALAAAMESLGNSLPSVGYGLAYPLGILGVIFLVQGLPPLLKINLKEEEAKFQKELGIVSIVSKSFKLTNQNLSGKMISEVFQTDYTNIRVVRIKRGERIIPVYPDTNLEINDLLLVVGTEESLKYLETLVGINTKDIIPQSKEAKSRWMMIASKSFVGKKLAHLEISGLFGVLITRVRRGNVEFVPHSDFRFEAGDEIRVSGSPADLHRFKELIGTDKNIIYETDIFSFAIGLSLGVLVGLIKIPITSKLFLSLGVAGGPLLVGLLFGYFGRFGFINARMPKAAQFVAGELGLYMFLAVAGCMAGQDFIEIFRERGLILITSGLLITITPVLIAVLVGHYIMKVNFLILLGMICGGMTSTPSLGIVSKSVQSDIPALGYTGIYPLAILLTTFFAQLLILF